MLVCHIITYETRQILPKFLSNRQMTIINKYIDIIVLIELFYTFNLVYLLFQNWQIIDIGTAFQRSQESRMFTALLIVWYFQGWSSTHISNWALIYLSLPPPSISTSHLINPEREKNGRYQCYNSNKHTKLAVIVYLS